MKIPTTTNTIPKITYIIALILSSVFWATTAFAHISPEGCTGSGLGISFYSDVPQITIGSTISYSLSIFNSAGNGTGIVCDASNIQASITTPDNIIHPISLIRTSLTNGQSNYYLNVVTYVARSEDIQANGALVATASDTGDIHQNDTDSQGSGNQNLNVTIRSALHVIKQVVNDNGGAATASLFNLHVKSSAGVDVTGSPATGTVAPGTLYSLPSGTYTVSEDINASYTQSFSGDCDSSGNITLVAGDNKTCTIINNDIAPKLIVNKIVINDNNGTKVISNFSLFIDGNAVTHGETNTVSAGLHTISETSDPNYTSTIGGNCAIDGTITLAPGDIKTCTITNNDIAPRSIVNKTRVSALHVIKQVVNDNGGAATASLFNLHVKSSAGVDVTGSPATGTVAPGTLYSLPSGTYTVSEDTNASYTQSFSGDCDSSGNITLVAGDNKTCTIINNDIAPVDVVRSGGGHTTLSTPPPPLIDVTKVPNPLSLPTGGGTVIYTNKVTNPGIVPLTNVSLTDDKCSPVRFISGDINNNAKLDTSETWTYTCQSDLIKTTTNTVTAVGSANGFTVRDSATASVIVATPSFPKTGLPPSSKTNLLNIIMLCSTLLLPILIYATAKRQNSK